MAVGVVSWSKEVMEQEAKDWSRIWQPQLADQKLWEVPALKERCSEALSQLTPRRVREVCKCFKSRTSPGAGPK